MRAAVCRAFGSPLEIEDLVLEPPREGEVDVRLVACAICHSDIALLDGAWGGDLPAVYGHEAAGVVNAVGPGVDGRHPGCSRRRQPPALVRCVLLLPTGRVASVRARVPGRPREPAPHDARRGGLPRAAHGRVRRIGRRRRLSARGGAVVALLRRRRAPRLRRRHGLRRGRRPCGRARGLERARRRDRRGRAEQRAGRGPPRRRADRRRRHLSRQARLRRCGSERRTSSTRAATTCRRPFAPSPTAAAPTTRSSRSETRASSRQRFGACAAAARSSWSGMPPSGETFRVEAVDLAHNDVRILGSKMGSARLADAVPASGRALRTGRAAARRAHHRPLSPRAHQRGDRGGTRRRGDSKHRRASAPNEDRRRRELRPGRRSPSSGCGRTTGSRDGVRSRRTTPTSPSTFSTARLRLMRSGATPSTSIRSSTRCRSSSTSSTALTSTERSPAWTRRSGTCAASSRARGCPSCSAASDGRFRRTRPACAGTSRRRTRPSASSGSGTSTATARSR